MHVINVVYDFNMVDLKGGICMYLFLEILGPKCGDVLVSQYKRMNSPFLPIVQLLHSLVTQTET